MNETPELLKKYSRRCYLKRSLISVAENDLAIAMFIHQLKHRCQT